MTKERNPRQRHVWEIPFPQESSEESSDHRTAKAFLLGQYLPKAVSDEFDHNKFTPDTSIHEADIEQQIAAKWQPSADRGDWAGALVRLKEIRVNPQSGRLRLHAQPADYRQYVGLKDNYQWARDRGIFSLTHPLCASVALRTVDNQLPLIIRHGKPDNHPRKLGTIGDFAIPLDFMNQEKVAAALDSNLDDHQFNLNFGTGRTIAQTLLQQQLWTRLPSGIFRTGIREIVEETNLTLTELQLDQMRLFAFIEEFYGCYAAAALFTLETTQTIEQIQRRSQSAVDSEGEYRGLPLGKTSISRQLKEKESIYSQIFC